MAKYTEKEGAGGGLRTLSKKKQRIEKKYLRHQRNQEQSQVKVEPSKCTIIYGGGDISMEAEGNVFGMQIHYTGNITIVSEHNKAKDLNNNSSGGWYLGANNKTGRLVYFSASGESITGKMPLFKYRGNLIIKDIVVAGLNTGIKGYIRRHLTDKFKSIDLSFNKVSEKWEKLNRTGKAPISSNRSTRYEMHFKQKIKKRSKTYKKTNGIKGGGY